MVAALVGRVAGEVLEENVHELEQFKAEVRRRLVVAKTPGMRRALEQVLCFLGEEQRGISWLLDDVR